MLYWIIFHWVFVIVCAQDIANDNENCGKSFCVGEEYECSDGLCYCAPGFAPDYFQTRCVPCPGFGEQCYNRCCNRYGNTTLHCWHGTCQMCSDRFGQWICREPIDNVLLISTTQVIMASALVLGIIATFVLLYKLCAVSSLRPLGRTSDFDSRLSIGSLQLRVEERLRDAPPRYTRNCPVDSIRPAVAYLNTGFVHDSSVPPPPYSPPEVKSDSHQHSATVHI